ncbi:hypothetical protein Scep_003020 [Stephania cephalantha]|uniref:SHSP domain-containing protein n=1 Tax=Stephania cephalantha TaxID=152367 RepID=A0AAP0Q6D9_9MAGN
MGVKAAAALLMVMLAALMILVLVPCTTALVPYGAGTNNLLWDMMTTRTSPISTVDALVDPFRILEQTHPAATKVALVARADWKETPAAHIITLDVPGIKREEVKIEVEENRVVRISGERKGMVVDGEKWHRAERINGKFSRQFRLPYNADLDGISARLENGVLNITVPKLVEDKKRQPKLVDIVHQDHHHDRNDQAAADIIHNYKASTSKADDEM